MDVSYLIPFYQLKEWTEIKSELVGVARKSPTTEILQNE